MGREFKYFLKNGEEIEKSNTLGKIQILLGK